jgi:hypothetical protein
MRKEHLVPRREFTTFFSALATHTGVAFHSPYQSSDGTGCFCVRGRMGGIQHDAAAGGFKHIVESLLAVSAETGMHKVQDNDGDSPLV